ncbi:MAG: cadmium-translocating P-type ATPase [Lachnospiraceae bacterium]|nr:cadmium-translocating P-type ATPase [Lachnospiraceae bacterium]
MNKKQKKSLIKIIIAAVLVIALAVIEVLSEKYGVIPELPKWLAFVLYMIPYLVVGYDILWRAIKNIRNGQVFDENFLMAVATIGAIALGEYREGVAVMLFYQIGEFFQSYAVGKSRKNITALMDIRPDYANLETAPGESEKVDPDEVEIGSVIVIKPGEKIPLDGKVIEGESALDTAALTGESLPRTVRAGDDVLSGCINMTGLLRALTTAEFEESTASKILDMVENASSKKSRSENFISKFAKYYTPIVCYSALALAVIPPVVNLITGNAPGWGNWIYRALTFLVISCPCALVISIPLSFFAGIGGASKAGVLIKGSNYLEALSKVKAVAFDKTGTLTKGSFSVTEIAPSEGVSEEELLKAAAYVESYSTHPIAISLRDAYVGKFNTEIDKAALSDVKEVSGHGVTAVLNGSKIAAGNEKMMRDVCLSYSRCDKPGTVVYVSKDGSFMGYILISDTPKEGAKEAVEGLKKAGIERVIMLTGDSPKAAEDIANRVGVTEFHAGLLPGDKVSRVEDILKQTSLAFVGDGINDAPVLTRSDVGIAMGALGSDAAIEAADIVLMDDDPRKVRKAIRISKKCMRIVYENIVFAIGIKVLCLILGALGIANMWVAIFADVGVMVIAVLNAIRTMWVKNL